MSTLRNDLIRLARDNKNLRPHLLPLLGQFKKAAAKKSLQGYINQALGEIAKGVGEAIVKHNSKGFGKMSKPGSVPGLLMGQEVFGELRNQVTPTRPGSLLVQAQWHQQPSVRIVAKFPNQKTLDREYGFRVEDDLSPLVRRISKAAVRDLGTWATDMGWA